MREDFKEKYKTLPPETLSSYGIISHAKKSGYVCPFCGNGHGEDGTGVDWNFLNGSYVAHCFKCDKAYDVFEVVAYNHHIDAKSNFPEVIQIMKEIFGDSDSKKVSHENVIKMWNKNLADFVGIEYRGINLETYKKFMCGYNPDDRRFIIPTSYYHYLERYTGDKDIKSAKKHTGEKEIFAFKKALDFDIIFIVEGEFDALSLWDLNFPAISFSGSDISKKQQNIFKQFPQDKKFIILYDNDDTGLQKAPKVQKIIQSLGYLVTIAHLSKFNDPNDFLQNNRADLQNELSEILKTAEFKKPTVELRELVRFQIKNNGIYYVGGKKDEKIAPVPITISKFINDEKREFSFTELTWTDKTTRREMKKLFDSKKIYDSKSILCLNDSNIGITARQGKYLCEFFAEYADVNCESIPDVTLYRKPGWTDDKSKFIYPGNSDDYYLYNGYNYADKFCTKGDRNLWLELFKQSWQSLPLKLVTGAFLAAPIIPFTNNRSVQIAIVAGTGKGKSALCALGASIFGNPEKLKNTFNGTNNWLNDIGFKYNNLPCWVDEFQTANVKLKENFDEAVYDFEVGKSRARLNRDGTDREILTYQGSRVYTAEQSLLKDSAMGGAMARLITINESYFIDNDSAQNLHMFTKDNYGFFGKLWCEYVGKHRDEIHKRYENLFGTVRKKMQDETHNDVYLINHIMTICTISVALKYFLEMLSEYDDEILKVSKPFNPEYDIADIDLYYATNFIRIYIPTAEELSTAYHAKNFLLELISTHDKQFTKQVGLGNSKNDWLPVEVSGGTIGVKFENGDVGFYPHAVNKLLRAEGFPSGQDVFKYMSEKFMLKIDAESPRKNKYQSRPYVMGERKYLYVIKKSVLDE